MPDLLPNFHDIHAGNRLEIATRFYAASRQLMEGYELAIGDRAFRISALELYLKLHRQRDVWFDESTDRTEVAAAEQRRRGTWYVNQAKGSRRWRIDITAGNREHDVQAGILIRQLDGFGGRQPGPAVALHRVIRGEFKKGGGTEEEHALLGLIHGRKIDGSDGSPLILRPLQSAIPLPLACGRRFNISKRIEEQYRAANLRVSLHRKYSNDRPLLQ